MLATRRSIATTALALTLSLACVGGAHAADQPGETNETVVGAIRIIEPWARASAGMATVGAAYMTIENTGATADRLIEAASPAAETVELHTHIVEGDIMRMRAVEGIDLPPGETVELQPGGLHVMLIGLGAPLEMGEYIPLTLTFAEAGTTTVEVEILQPGAMEPGRDHAGGDHAGDDGQGHTQGHGHHHHGDDQGRTPVGVGVKQTQ
jgi:periplasmic copper chaperone A